MKNSVDFLEKVVSKTTSKIKDNVNQWEKEDFAQNQWQQPNQKPIVPCICPRCGANLLVEAEIDTFYCQYCGCKIMIQNEVNLKTRYGMKKLDHTEKMTDKVIGFFDKRSVRNEKSVRNLILLQ